MSDQQVSPSNILPHSYPFVLLDKIIEFKEGKRITCLKNLSINEEFFLGHFRDNPIMPGVLILEMMAQASGLIIGKEKSSAYLTRIKDAVFKHSVIPGDQLIVTSSLIHRFEQLYIFEALVNVEDKTISQAEITLSLF